jgi:hypothetical protein
LWVGYTLVELPGLVNIQKTSKNIKKHQKNYGKSTFLMGKATISTGPSIQ